MLKLLRFEATGVNPHAMVQMVKKDGRLICDTHVVLNRSEDFKIDQREIILPYCSIKVAVNTYMSTQGYVTKTFKGKKMLSFGGILCASLVNALKADFNIDVVVE